MGIKFETYQDGSPKNTRSWSVFENDGSEDGRLVCSSATKPDAEKVAALLNGPVTERVFVSNDFQGHVGSAAVIVAADEDEALTRLNAELAERKLPQTQPGRPTVREVDLSESSVDILVDGDY